MFDDLYQQAFVWAKKYGQQNNLATFNVKPDIMARHNVIYVKEWCSHDNPLDKVVPGKPKSNE